MIESEQLLCERRRNGNSKKGSILWKWSLTQSIRYEHGAEMEQLSYLKMLVFKQLKMSAAIKVTSD